MVLHSPRGNLGHWAFLFSVILVGVLANPLPPLASAQEAKNPPEQPPTFELQEVTIAGKRPQPVTTTPAYVTVIPREELQRMGFLTLADALQFVSEVSVRSTGSGMGGSQQASIRGSTPQQVLVMIDGVPLNSVSDFGVNLSTVAVADIERVEVLRGPYSAIYGSALGGVIHVITRSDRRASAAARAGSFGTVVSDIRAAGPSPSAASAGLQYFSTAGDRVNSDGVWWTGTLKVQPDPDAGQQLAFSLERTVGQSGSPGPTTGPTPQDRIADRRTIASLSWMRQEPEGASRQTRVWWLGEELGFATVGFQSTSQASAVGFDWQMVSPQGSERVWTWGVEWQSPSRSGSYQATSNTGAAYVQLDVVRGEKTFAGIGLRYDLDSAYGGQVDPRLGIVHFLSPAVRLRASLGRTFRAPSLGELYFPGCSNPGLRPEQAWSADLGLESTAWQGLAVRLNGFYVDATNLIIGGCTPQNVGSARMVGVTYEMVGRLAEQWALSTNLTWTDGLNRVSGQPLLRVAPIQANLVLRYAWDENRTLSLLGNYVSARPDIGGTTVAASTTFGLRYDQPLGDATARIGVDNLFDTSYETLSGYPGPRRSVYVQFERVF
ncbi:MAG TPA: TonB-dependent receptor [bacterium]